MIARFATMVEQIGLVLFLLYYIPLISALNVRIHTSDLLSYLNLKIFQSPHGKQYAFWDQSDAELLRMDRFDGTQIGLTERYQFKAGNYDPVLSVHDKYADSGYGAYNVPAPQQKKKGGKQRLPDNYIDSSVRLRNPTFIWWPSFP